MSPVNGAVHADRDAQGLQLPVLPDAGQDGRQPGGHQVGGAEGDHGADVLHRHAVVVRGGQAQVQEDGPGVAQAVLVPEGEEGGGGGGRRRRRRRRRRRVCQYSHHTDTSSDREIERARQTARDTKGRQTDVLLFHGSNVGCGDLPFGPQGVGNMAVKKQSLLGHLQNHQPHQLAQIQTTDQLLKAEREICCCYKVQSLYYYLWTTRYPVTVNTQVTDTILS